MPDDIAIWLDNAGVELTPHTKSYKLESDFLSVSNHLQVDLWKADRVAFIDDIVLPKERISFVLNGRTIFRGNIDRRRINEQGVISIEANDYLANLADSSIDYTQRFKKGESLEQVLKSILRPCGITSIVDGGYNAPRADWTGVTAYRQAPIVDFKTLKITEFKPSPGDTIREMVRRLLDRHALLLQPTAKRDQIALAQPEYRQPAIFNAVRFLDAPDNRKNNILSGDSTEDWTNVISYVQAKGIGGDPDENRVGLQTMYPVFGPDSEHPIGQIKRVAAIAFGPNGNRPLYFNGELGKNETPGDVLYTPLFIKDKTSKSQKELDKFVLKEVAERLQNILTCSYELKGHSQDGINYCPDTMWTVVDHACRVFETMWCQKVSFSGSESTDQTTQVDLYLPNAFLL